MRLRIWLAIQIRKHSFCITRIDPAKSKIFFFDVPFKKTFSRRRRRQPTGQTSRHSWQVKAELSVLATVLIYVLAEMADMAERSFRIFHANFVCKAVFTVNIVNLHFLL